ncbi:unnamed protein product, partial [Effrenium voratum]
GPRQTVHRWISSPVFDSFIGFIISVNAGTIGYEAQVSTKIPWGCDERCSCEDPGCSPMPEWLQAASCSRKLWA